MIILDTNVLSALMLEKPDISVALWLDRQPRTSVWTTSITILEIRSGLLAMVSGRRRARLENLFTSMIEERLEQRVLTFDQPAAEEAATVSALRRRVGQPRELRDTMIAGIALAQRATLATRNVRYFDDLKLAVIDPWRER
jgi:predicted nucleic acid-binding protein